MAGEAARLDRLDRLARDNAVLRVEVERLAGENQRLQVRVAELAARVEELRRAAERQAAPFQPRPCPQPQAAGPQARLGVWAHGRRRAPERVDRVVDVGLPGCCPRTAATAGDPAGRLLPGPDRPLRWLQAARAAAPSPADLGCAGRRGGVQLARRRVRPTTVEVSEPSPARPWWSGTQLVAGEHVDACPDRERRRHRRVGVDRVGGGGGGVGGFFERTFASLGLRRVYEELLDRLSRAVGAQPAR